MPSSQTKEMNPDLVFTKEDQERLQLFIHLDLNLPPRKDGYNRHWQQISYLVRKKYNWKCQYCGLQGLRPGERSDDLNRSEWMALTVITHHLDFNRQNDCVENLICACPTCHRRIHQSKYSSVSPGQLSLFEL